MTKRNRPTYSSEFQFEVAQQVVDASRSIRDVLIWRVTLVITIAVEIVSTETIRQRLAFKNLVKVRE